MAIKPARSTEKPTMIVKLGYRFMVFGLITSRSKVDDIYFMIIISQLG